MLTKRTILCKHLPQGVLQGVAFTGVQVSREKKAHFVSVATPAEPRGEKKSVQILGHKRLLEQCQ